MRFMQRYLSLLFFSFSTLYALEFSPSHFGIKTTYLRGSGKEKITSSPNFFQVLEEKMEPYQGQSLGVFYQYLEKKRPYFHIEGNYRWIFSSNSHIYLEERVTSSFGALTFSEKLEAKASGYSYQGKVEAGYPFTFGPLTTLLKIGGFGEKEKIERFFPVTTFTASSGSTQGTLSFFPVNDLSHYELSPLTGIELILQPWPASYLRLIAGYTYNFGWGKNRSKYESSSTITQDSQSSSYFLTRRFSSRPFLETHSLKLATLIRWASFLASSLEFHYIYKSAKPVTADLTLSGVAENTAIYQQNLSQLNAQRMQLYGASFSLFVCF